MGGKGELGRTERGGVRLPAPPGVDFIDRRDQRAVHSPGLPQTWGANHHTVILAPVPGATHLTSGCPRAGLPAEAPGEGPPRLLQLLGSLGIRPWAGGRLPPLSACISTCLSSSVSYKDPVPGFRATPIQGGLISDLHSIISAVTLFPN